MNNLYTFLPNLEADEYQYIQSLLSGYSDEQIKNFANIYSSRRKDPQTILLLAAIGFLGINGIHRFVIDQIGMGILYLLTGGLCLVGTIVDMINYKKLSFEYNTKAAREVAAMFK